MSMTCKDLVEMLCDFIDEGLSPEIRALIDHHLCGCPDCTVSVNDYRATIHVTRALARGSIDSLPTAVEARLRAVIAIHVTAQDHTTG